MKNKMIQLRRYYTGCFFSLALISCGKLSNQAKRQPREAESTEERESVRPQRKTTFQKNTKATGIPKIKTLILALLAASQIQLSSTEKPNIIKEIDFTAYEECPAPIQIHLDRNFIDTDMLYNINLWLSCQYPGRVPSCFNHIIMTTDKGLNPKNITTNCTTKETNTTISENCEKICVHNLEGARQFMNITKSKVTQEYFFNSLQSPYCPVTNQGGSKVRCEYSDVPFVQTYPNGTSFYHTLRIEQEECKPSEINTHHTCTKTIYHEGLPDITKKTCSKEKKQEGFKKSAENVIKFTEEQDCTENPERTNAFIIGSVQLYHQGRCLGQYQKFYNGFKSITQRRSQESTTGRTTTTTSGLFSSTFPSSTISESDYADVVYEKELTQENQQAERGKIEKESQQAQRKKRQTEEKHKQKSKQKKQRKPFSRHR